MIEVLSEMSVEEARASALSEVVTKRNQQKRDVLRLGFINGEIHLKPFKRLEAVLNRGGILPLSNLDELAGLLEENDFSRDYITQAVNIRRRHEVRASRVGFGFRPGVRFVKDYRSTGGILYVLSDLVIPNDFTEIRARKAMIDVCGSSVSLGGQYDA